MKKLILTLLVCCFSFSVFADGEMNGEEILAFVRSRLTLEPVKLTGNLKNKAANGFVKKTVPVSMQLNRGAEIPAANYTVGTQQLGVKWIDDTPIYSSDDESKSDFNPNTQILDTGVYWADLSFSVLWWPGAKFIKEDKKINRRCYIVDVPVPDSSDVMRLWIEKKMGILLEAQTLNAKGKQTRRVKIKSIKKMEEMWFAKDLEIYNPQTKEKTILQIDKLEVER